MQKEFEIKWNKRKSKLKALTNFSEFVESIKEDMKELPEDFDLSYVNEEEDKVDKVVVDDDVKYKEALRLLERQKITFSINKRETKSPLINLHPLKDNDHEESINRTIEDIREQLEEEIRNTKLPIYIEDDSIEFNEEEGWEDMVEEEVKVESPIENKDTEPCKWCNGTGIKEKQKTCKKCLGTGRLNKHMVKYFKKSLKKIAQSLEEESKVFNFLEHSIYDKKEARCIQCSKEIEGGNPIYTCCICDCSFCEDCDAIVEHIHSRLKHWTKGKRVNYKADIKFLDQAKELKGQEIKRLVIKNIGRLRFPTNTIFAPINDKNMDTIQIGSLEKGQSFETWVKFKIPSNGEVEYQYILFVNDTAISKYIPVKIKAEEDKSESKDKELEKIVKKKELTPERAYEYSQLVEVFRERYNYIDIFKSFKKHNFDFHRTSNKLAK